MLANANFPQLLFKTYVNQQTKSTLNKLRLPTTCVTAVYVQLLISFHRVYLFIFCSTGQPDSGSRLNLGAILGIIFSVLFTISLGIAVGVRYITRRNRPRPQIVPAPQDQVNQAFTITYHR